MIMKDAFKVYGKFCKAPCVMALHVAAAAMRE